MPRADSTPALHAVPDASGHAYRRARAGAHAAFRPDIEGLRGIAVLAVVLYHAFPAALPGGFLGVDIFFVISGYLITQLLCRELDATGRIDLPEFWARRIRRIAPAATVVLLAIASAVFIVNDFNGRVIGRQITAAALSYYNWRQIAQGVDYLAHDDSANPVLHYWSLSVEEQFYLAWPLLLLGLALTLRRELTMVAIALAALASFALAMRLAPADPSLAFFGTGTRAWELLIGGLAAMLPAIDGARARVTLQALGLGAVVVGIAVAHDGQYQPALAVAPTLGTAALLYAGMTPVGGALAVPPLAFTGRISFSLYLWHWPLLVFLPPTLTGNLAALVLALLASVATFRFVEHPLRASPFLRRSRAATYALGALLIGSTVLVGVLLRIYGPDRIPVIYNNGCLLDHATTDYPPCVYGAVDGEHTVVLFGDSHAANWFDALDHAASQRGWRLLVRVKAACAPAERVQRRLDGSEYHQCATWRHKVLRELGALRPALVVVSGSTGGVPEGERAVLEALAASAPTLAVRDAPILPLDAPKCLRHPHADTECSWPLTELLHRRGTYPATSADDMPAGVRLLDLTGRVCPGQRCGALVDGRLVMFDDQHLTNSFSATMAKDFEPYLR